MLWLCDVVVEADCCCCCWDVVAESWLIFVNWLLLLLFMSVFADRIEYVLWLLLDDCGLWKLLLVLLFCCATLLRFVVVVVGFICVVVECDEDDNEVVVVFVVVGSRIFSALIFLYEISTIFCVHIYNDIIHQQSQ